MQVLFYMPEKCSHGEFERCGDSVCARRLCKSMWVRVMLCACAATVEAAAAEQRAPLDGTQLDIEVSNGQPALAQRPPTEFKATTLLPDAATAALRLTPPAQLTAPPAFSTTEFRPRGPSLLERDPPGGAHDEAPMLGGTTVWQRLSDFRSHNRVRLLTLWEAGGSSVSLQTGRKGEPSLQWTSRSLNRGGATRGLFDQVFTASIAGAGRGLHFAPHTIPPEPISKPAKLPDLNR